MDRPEFPDSYILGPVLAHSQPTTMGNKTNEIRPYGGRGQQDGQGQPPPQQPQPKRGARAMPYAITAATNDGNEPSFPPGAMGLDSWASIQLLHRTPSAESALWDDELALAWGTCKCNHTVGKKGIPLCEVEKTPEGSNIDLLPLGELCERGCKYIHEGKTRASSHRKEDR